MATTTIAAAAADDDPPSVAEQMLAHARDMIARAVRDKFDSQIAIAEVYAEAAETVLAHPDGAADVLAAAALIHRADTEIYGADFLLRLARVRLRVARSAAAAAQRAMTVLPPAPPKAARRYRPVR